MSKGAITLAEGSQKKKYKTDATLVLNGVEEHEHILRTVYDKLSAWKACEYFGVKNPVSIHMHSANINPKIAQEDLHETLESGGATSVQVDARKLNYKSGNNLGTKSARIKTNMHVARITF